MVRSDMPALVTTGLSNESWMLRGQKQGQINCFRGLQDLLTKVVQRRARVKGRMRDFATKEAVVLDVSWHPSLF